MPLPTGYPELDRYFGHIFFHLNAIGNSQLGLRAANATICSIFVFIISLCESSRKRAAFTVVSFCFTLLWSNDYGVFSALSVMATYGLAENRANGLSLATLKRAAIVAGASVATDFVGVTILSGGHPLLWISRNVMGVAQDQMWYFLLDEKVLTLSDIRLALPSTLKLWASVAMVACVVLWRPRIPALYVCTALVFTTLGAGLVSQIGGHISEHYMIAFERAFWPVMSVWAVCLTRVVLTKFVPPRLFGGLFFLIGLPVVIFVAMGDSGSRMHSFAVHISGGIEYWFTPKLPPIYFVFGILLAHYALSAWVSRRWANTAVAIFLLGFIIVPRRSDSSNLLTPFSLRRDVSIAPTLCTGRKEIYIPSLGGCLRQDRAESLDRFAVATNRSSDLFSTYSSAFDVMTGAFNSSGSDYIIHALGEEWRARYESALAEGKHEYLTTIREDFTYWESWVRRMNWGTYVGILSRYNPIASTDYNILWRRSATVAQNLAAGTCEILRQSPTSTLLKVTAPTNLRGPGYVDINVEYALSQGPWWRSPYPIHSYVTVQDGWPQYSGSYGIPSRSGAHSWRFPVEFREKDFLTSERPHRVVTITALPAGSELGVSKCWSHFSVDASRFLPPNK